MAIPKFKWSCICMWFLLALPWLACLLLVQHYALNQRIMDDWLMGEDLLLFKQGKLQLWDLLGVQMEHRIFVPRVIALGMGLLFKGDVRALLVVTMVLVTIEYLVVIWLWFRISGLRRSACIVGSLLSGFILLNPIQYQTFCWPICFLAVIPVGCLCIMIRLLLGSWSVYLRMTVALLCAWTGMLSFAPGMLCWVLPIPIMLWVAPMPTRKVRIRFLLAWIGFGVISFVLYFHNFQNAVFAAYSYGQKDVNVLERDSSYLLSQPGMACGFYLRWLGSFLSHGLHLDQELAAATLGGGELMLFLGLVAYTLRHWKTETLRRSMVVCLTYGMYTVITGAMVTMGRLWMEHVETTSLNLRYHIHQTPLLCSLLAGLWITGNHWRSQRIGRCLDWLGVLGTAVLGGLAVFLAFGWSYGSSMMEVWHLRHLRDGAAQRFLGLAQKNYIHSMVALNFDFGRRVALGLDSYGYLDPPLFKKTDLNQYRMQPNPRHRKFSGFDRLWKQADGSWWVRGYSLLPDRERASDLILFAYRREPAEGWQIFGFTTVYAVPMTVTRDYWKDMEWITMETRKPWPVRLSGAWFEAVALLSEPPEDAQISAWSLDAKRNVVQRIPLGFEFSGGDKEGVSLEEISRGTSTESVDAPMEDPTESDTSPDTEQ